MQFYYLYEAARDLWRWILRDPAPRLITISAYVAVPWCLFTFIDVRAVSNSTGELLTIAGVIFICTATPFTVGCIAQWAVRKIESLYIGRLITDKTEAGFSKLLAVDRVIFGSTNLADIYDEVERRIAEMSRTDPNFPSPRILQGIHRVMLRCRYAPLCKTIFDQAPRWGNDSTLLNIPWCIASFAEHPQEQDIANAGAQATRSLRKRLEKDEVGNSLLRPTESPEPDSELLRPASATPSRAESLLRPAPEE